MTSNHAVGGSSPSGRIMRIVFLGSGAFGLPSLNALAASGHSILHVVSQPDRSAGRGKVLTPTPVAQWAIERGVGLTRMADANGAEVLALLRSLRPECLVVIAFGQKLSDELLSTAARGGINLHSSLLPKYRGAAPINWAVINGDTVAGVCVIEITNVMDGGDILAVAETPIGESETAGELHDRLAELGAPLLPRVLDEIADGTVRRVRQERGAATRAPKLSREMAWVDFSQPSSVVSARIRGMSPWPGVQVEYFDPTGKMRTRATLLKVRATASTVSHGAEMWGIVLADGTVACAIGSIEILMIQPANKKPMDVAAFRNGYEYGVGARVRSEVRYNRKMG